LGVVSARVPKQDRANVEQAMLGAHVTSVLSHYEDAVAGLTERYQLPTVSKAELAVMLAALGEYSHNGVPRTEHFDDLEEFEDFDIGPAFVDELRVRINCDCRLMRSSESAAAAVPGDAYTVLLRYPDYLASSYGEDTYLAHVRAPSAEAAVLAAQEEAIKVQQVDDEDIDASADDFAPLLCLKGWHHGVEPGPAPAPAGGPAP